LWNKPPYEEKLFFNSCQIKLTRSINVHPTTSITDMDMWKLWPTNQTKTRILMSDKQEAPSKLTEAQKEMVTRIREMDKKTKGL
jgi:hypothetical protein